MLRRWVWRTWLRWRERGTPTLEHYIGLQVVVASAVVLAVLVGMDLLGVVIRRLGRASSEPVFGSLHDLFLDSWTDALEYFPYACLLGALWVFCTLVRHRELLAVQGLGLGHVRILWMGLRLPVLFACALVIAQQFVPSLMHTWAQADSRSGVAVSAQKGAWYVRTDGYWRVFGTDASGERADRLEYYGFDDKHRLEVIAYADNAYYDATQGRWRAPHWRQKWIEGRGVRIEEVQDTEGALSHLYLDVLPRVLHLMTRHEDYLSLSHRWVLAHRPEMGEESMLRHEFIFWRTIVLPLLTMSMALVAFSIAVRFGYRKDTLVQAFLGVLLGIFFAFINNLVFSAGLVFEWRGWFVALLPIGLALICGLWLLNKGMRISALVYNLREVLPRR